MRLKEFNIGGAGSQASGGSGHDRRMTADADRRQKIKKAKPEAEVTTPRTASIKSLKRLNLNKIVIYFNSCYNFFFT